MNEIKPNIHVSEDGEHTDFVVEILVSYNGETRSVKNDFGAFCDEKGQITDADYDKAMRHLNTAVYVQFKCFYKIIKENDD